MLIVEIAAAVLLVILAVAATKPATYGVKRSIDVSAPPARVLPFIVDFRQWPRWSPFEALDPALERSYSGAPIGTGAIYEWSGNGQAGKGRMEIASATDSSVSIDVQFVKPFAANNVNQFTLVPSDNSTRVTWEMNGTRPFVLKVMNVFVSPDRLMGKHFETGLSNLKRAAEAAPTE